MHSGFTVSYYSQNDYKVLKWNNRIVEYAILSSSISITYFEIIEEYQKIVSRINVSNI